MMAESSLHPSDQTWPQRLSVYYGWICVIVAAFAMTATLPGRTHGLGLITEPLLETLSLERTTYGRINLACTLLGAAFCIPIGVLIDRYGVRLVLTLTVLFLGLSVLAMGRVRGPISLFLTLLLVRGFGQGALSVISMAIVGKWFRRRLGAAMGLLTVLLTFGFIGTILGMGAAVKTFGWREAWLSQGWILLALVPFAWLLTRDTPEASGLSPEIEFPADQATPDTDATVELRAYTLLEALKTPVFWIFTAGTASFNLVWSAITLFNESILEERGFDADTAVQIMAILTGVGLVSNVLAGKLATRERLGLLLGMGMFVLAVSLACFPSIRTITQVRLYAMSLGLTGGIVMVIFFAAWGHLFGRKHLGQIQSVAQIISILASASGPFLLAECEALTGSFTMMFYLLALLVGLVSLAALFTRPPHNLYQSVPQPVPAVSPRLEPVE